MRILQSLNLKATKAISTTSTRCFSTTPSLYKAKQSQDEDASDDFGDLIGGTTEEPVQQSTPTASSSPLDSAGPWKTAVDYLSPKLADGQVVNPNNRPKARRVIDALVHAKNEEQIDVGIDLYRRWQSFKLGVNRNAHSDILTNLCKQGRADVAFEFLSDFRKFNLTLPDRRTARTLSLALFDKKDDVATPLQLLPVLRAFHYRPHDAFCVANAIRSLEKGDENRIALLDWLKALDVRRVIPVEVSQLEDAQKVWSDLRTIAEEEGRGGEWLDTLGQKLTQQLSKQEKYAQRKAMKQQKQQQQQQI
ncbi:hypothetical protein E3P99_00860 [Wallemia hederae]|uniref:Uncharacterized protein n=1 Tax=Wallemia hederae TaxID=1540922 RepID=A0A4T0FSX8_9BASI|nr:hypothetical protein E3P99_00860 [Wallemia hederae]